MHRNTGDTTEGIVTAAGLVATADRKLVLVVVLSDGAIREFDMPTGGSISVGRTSAANVFIDDPSVSRNHAEVGIGPGGPIVRDLGSRNGTYVNDERIAQSFVGVLVGDTLRFGSTTALFHSVPIVQDFQPAQQIAPDDLDARLVAEGERCVRFDRALSLLVIEHTPRDEVTCAAIQTLLTATLRAVDVYATRTPGRLDVLLAECASEEAKACAARIDEGLRKLGIKGNLGVATFPNDAASIDRLPVIAAMLMRSAGRPGVTAAADGARTIHLPSADVVIADPSMVRLFDLVQRAASTTVPVLIAGESGTGKGVIAEALHVLGSRRGGPFVRLDCAGDSSSLPQAIAEARGGTLLLEELHELSAPSQAQLADAMEGELAETRFVGATSSDLESAVDQGRFRSELMLLFKGLVLAVPPLRDRPKEIRLLAERFVSELAGADRQHVSLAPTALTALRRYPWGGNIRELKSVIANAVVACQGDQIELTHLLPELGAEPAASHELPLDAQVRAYERSRIEEALAECGGNQTAAAKLLKIPRRTLVSKMRAHGLTGSASRTRNPRNTI